MVATKPSRTPLREHDWSEPATHKDVLDATKVLADHVKAQLARDAEQRKVDMEQARQDLEESRVRVRELEQVIREGLEGQGKAFKDSLTREAMDLRSWFQDGLLRSEAKSLTIQDHARGLLGQLREDLQQGLSQESMTARIGKGIDEVLAVKAEDVQRRCEEAVRGIYERNAADLQRSYLDNLGYIKSVNSEMSKRLEEGLCKGLSLLEQSCAEKLSAAGKSLEDGASQVKSLEERFAEQFEEKLAKAIAALEARHAEKVEFLQRSHQESLDMVLTLLKGLNIPAPVVKNEIRLPDSLPPEVVVNIPPPKLLEKLIEYDDLGRPWRTEERELKGN